MANEEGIPRVRLPRLFGALVAAGAASAPCFAVADTISVGAANDDWTIAGTLKWLVPVLVSAAIALVVLTINTRQTARMHRERLQGDQALAREKMAADIALTERQHDADKELAVWRRKAEIAEQALTLFYEADAALRWVRTPAMLGGEGATRKAPEGEEPKVKELRDLYFVPLERLHADREVFSKLQSTKFLFTAYFGAESAAPFGTLVQVHNGIRTAASILMETAPMEEGSPPENLQPLKATLGWSKRPDADDQKIKQALEAMERTCKAAIAARPPDAAG